MCDETLVLDDLNELLFIAKFMLNRKKYKKDIKNIKKLIHKISNDQIDEVTVESDDTEYDG